jgi:hypothetical protein
MQQDWYWCLDHNAAEPVDSSCPPGRRWGPYKSREEAEHWRDRVTERNEEWDASDREWEQRGAPGPGNDS